MLSLYGIRGNLFTRASTTLPKTCNDVLMQLDSFNRIPLLPVSRLSSEPAKSTTDNLAFLQRKGVVSSWVVNCAKNLYTNALKC